jgi:hypothetical protein
MFIISEDEVKAIISFCENNLIVRQGLPIIQALSKLKKYENNAKEAPRQEISEDQTINSDK